MAKQTNTVLAGRRVWLTRPAHQARPWARVLEAAGALVVQSPLLAIEGPPQPDAARRGLDGAERADIVIATSRNAVDSAWQLRPDFNPAGTLYAIGPASAEALEQASGRRVIHAGPGATSEQLLALPNLAAMAGQRVVLLSGVGGRTRLVDTLTERGAAVEKIELYRRRLVAIEPGHLAALLATSDAVVITSGEALSQLVHLAGRELRDALAAVQLVAPSARVVKKAQHCLNWNHPPVSVDCVSGDGVVAALARVWHGSRQ